MMLTGRAALALETFERARRAIGTVESGLPLRLQTAVVMASLAAMEPPATWIARLDRMIAESPGDGESHRLILACLAFGACATGDRTAEQVAGLALRAADGPLPDHDQWMFVNFVSVAFAISDRHVEAIDLLDRGIDVSRARGD